MPKKKKNKKEKIITIKISLETFKKIWDKIKKFFKHKVTKNSIIIIVIVTVLYGFSMSWSYDKRRGLRCNGGFSPPEPDTINKVIKR